MQPRLSLFLLAVTLGGCRTAPLAPIAEDAAGKSFAPPVGNGNLYIVRDETFIGRAYVFEVLVDGRLLGVTGPGTYLLVALSPGTHKVASTHTRFFSVDVAVEGGKNHFIRQIPHVDWPEPSASLIPIEENDGRAAVSKCKRVPNQF